MAVPPQPVTVPAPAAVPDAAAAVALALEWEFRDRLPRGSVAAVLAAARRDLEGQVPPASLGEMLHRLASYRLDRLVGNGRASDG